MKMQERSGKKREVTCKRDLEYTRNSPVEKTGGYAHGKKKAAQSKPEIQRYCISNALFRQKEFIISV